MDEFNALFPGLGSCSRYLTTIRRIGALLGSPQKSNELTLTGGVHPTNCLRRKDSAKATQQVTAYDQEMQSNMTERMSLVASNTPIEWSESAELNLLQPWTMTTPDFQVGCHEFAEDVLPVRYLRDWLRARIGWQDVGSPRLMIVPAQTSGMRECIQHLGVVKRFEFTVTSTFCPCSTILPQLEHAEPELSEITKSAHHPHPIRAALLNLGCQIREIISAAMTFPFFILLAWFIARFVVNRNRSDLRVRSPPVGSGATNWKLFKVKRWNSTANGYCRCGPCGSQHIFANIFTYMKSPTLRPIIANTIGKGLVWADGEDHVFQRRLLSPAFTLESVKEMAEDISECAEKLENTLINLALSNAGVANLNIAPYTSRCTLDVIGRVAFGHDFKFGESGSLDQFFRAFPMIVSFSLKYAKVQGRVKTMTGALAKRLIEDGSHVEKRKNILSILLRSQGKTGGLSNAQIIDNISTFIIVGHETTAGALNFALMELARSPRAQQKLREEVRNSRDAISYDGIQKLEFLDAVTKEVVQKGQVIHIPLMSMNTNPKVWGEDAGEFKPERWPTTLHWGYRLAVFEFKVILATLLRSLEFHSTDVTVYTKVTQQILQPVVDGKCGVVPVRITVASHT
ncbi:cytochrome P450 [Rickenella mellea]|uniref:Cytochrome P450 n=1 Tax=Rickenella mellea TaxID=50990 RepID=A0A4Y7QAT0_9AGAM|nr:cytochrome P450 [Rickenella mellea]